jgi:hypothetical protein
MKKKSISETPQSENKADYAGKIRRLILIILSVAGFGIFGFDYFQDGETEVLSQVCLRVAIVLGAAWLAYPQVEYLVKHSPLILILLCVVFIVFKNPLVLAVGILLCLVLVVLQYVVRVLKSK